MIAGRQPVLTGSSSAKVVSNQQPRLSSNFFKQHTSIQYFWDVKYVFNTDIQAKIILLDN